MLSTARQGHVGMGGDVIRRGQGQCIVPRAAMGCPRAALFHLTVLSVILPHFTPLWEGKILFLVGVMEAYFRIL